MMEQPWAIKYRPKKWEDLVGQPAVSVVLARMVARGKVPSALLFYGASGSGKTSAGRLLAAALNCKEENSPCGVCATCVSIIEGHGVDVIELDAASNGSIGTIRELVDSAQYSTGERYRVIILDEVHMLSPGAMDVMLKTLEETPLNTIFVLVTTKPERLNEPLRSRLMDFEFVKVATSLLAVQLRDIAIKENMGFESELIDELVDRSDGNLRNAIMRLDQLARAEIFSLKDYLSVYPEEDYGLELLALLVEGDKAGALKFLDSLLERGNSSYQILDSLILILNRIALHLAGQKKPNVAALAQDFPLNALPQVMAMIWEVRVRLRNLPEGRALVVLCVSMILERLHPSPEKIVVSTKEVDSNAPSLTVDELRAMMNP